jgi:hypothetical protein
VKPIFSRVYIILGGPLVSSLSLYSILSSLLLFPSDIAVPLSVILFSLLFGLSGYLLLGTDENRKWHNDLINENNTDIDAPSISYLPVHVKSPEIKINNGTVEFKLASNSNNPAQPEGNIVANRNIVANVDHVETYNSFNKNGTKTDFVTFAKSLDIQGNYMTESREIDTLRLPRDISVRAKDKGIGMPWETMMVSFTSVIIMISVVVVVIAVKYYIWPKIKQNKKEYQK